MSFARNFFNGEEQKLIIEAIAKAELKTSGEIRVHLDNFCFGDELKRAEKTFLKLNMHQTKERNGVLIYIATVSKKIAIVGDVGIHEKLGDQFWQNIIDELLKNFKENRKAQSLADAIVKCGEQLGKYFPGDAGDINELSNAISF